MTGERKELYEKTVQRLARRGIKDPTSQIIALAEEIEQYRSRIYSMQAQIDRLAISQNAQESDLLRILDKARELLEKEIPAEQHFDINAVDLARYAMAYDEKTESGLLED